MLLSCKLNARRSPYLNFIHLCLVIAPSTFCRLVQFGLLKASPDGSTIATTSIKRSHCEKRGGRLKKRMKIPVLISIRTKTKALPRTPSCLVPAYYLTAHKTLPVVTPWYREPTVISDCDKTPSALCPQCFSAKQKLPNILVCNARSLNNEADELEVIIKENKASITIISECWDMLTSESARIKGYTGYFNIRRDRGLNRHRGGVGLYFQDDLPSKLLSDPIDYDHEILWTECKPTHLSRRFSCLIVALVYYPESTRNRKELIEHTQFFVDKMRQKYASPAFMIAGNFNQTNKQWVSSVLDLRQVVAVSTHQSGSTLDLILMNLKDVYDAHRSLGPLQNSDHFLIFLGSKFSNPQNQTSQNYYTSANKRFDFYAWSLDRQLRI